MKKINVLFLVVLIFGYGFYFFNPLKGNYIDGEDFCSIKKCDLFNFKCVPLKSCVDVLKPNQEVVEDFTIKYERRCDCNSGGNLGGEHFKGVILESEHYIIKSSIREYSYTFSDISHRNIKKIHYYDLPKEGSIVEVNFTRKGDYIYFDMRQGNRSFWGFGCVLVGGLLLVVRDYFICSLHCTRGTVNTSQAVSRLTRIKASMNPCS